MSIAIAPDMRIGTVMARFACSYLNLGLGGADVGSSYFLPKLIGAAHPADMLYSGRIVEGMIRKASPLGLRMTKEVLNETVTGNSLENALKLENRNQILASQTAGAREAITAWFKKT